MGWIIQFPFGALENGGWFAMELPDTLASPSGLLAPLWSSGMVTTVLKPSVVILV